MYPEIDNSIKECAWTEFYWDAMKAIPINFLEPGGKKVDIWMLVHGNHEGDKMSCKSRSDFIIHINNALLQLYSKKQSPVETSVFGAELLAMKQGMDVF